MNLCQETSGFLFKHRCGRPSFMTCLTCRKPICAQHARAVKPEGFRCIACTTAAIPPGGGYVFVSTDSDDWDDDDPYYYRRHHTDSGGGQPDGMDFTDGDRSAVSDEGGGWEEDAAGS
jgi:hypothetical protein